VKPIPGGRHAVTASQQIYGKHIRHT
jgi:hypothetical protein